MNNIEPRELVLGILRSPDVNQRIVAELGLTLFVPAAKTSAQAAATIPTTTITTTAIIHKPARHANECLVPFPPHFYDSTRQLKRFDLIKEAIAEIPPLDQITQETQLSKSSWELLHWVFTNNPLRITPLDQGSEHCKLAVAKFNLPKTPEPNQTLHYLFKVENPNPKAVFIEGKAKYGTFFAFHGSRVPNFHSIIHRGFLASLNVRCVHGKGTYLSSSFAYSNSPIFAMSGAGWIHSMFGPNIKILAICEVVNDRRCVVTCKVWSGGTTTVRGDEDENLKPAAPVSTYIVKRDDFIQLSYLYLSGGPGY